MATASDGNGSGGASSTSPRRASASSRRRAAPTARSCLCQVVLLGDLNYRIYLGEAETRLLVKAKNWSILLQKDQLLSEFSTGWHFEGWQEGLITFSPTYKYHPNSDQYYWCLGEKKRAPAWCDRILWRGKGLTQIQYETCNYRLSDHPPITCEFVALPRWKAAICGEYMRSIFKML